ncbi:protein JINGUBANG-like [Corylus avellana]|uniref:protein JINGUBANG-like n=1 Tax=Corylus avellana TaxID=13451 RepID=UPI001E21B7DD|nr:protein JINGUBANG-like [Corylus avellana]
MHTTQTTLLAPQTNSHISCCLAVHDNLLYAASINAVNVFDLSNYTLVDAFNDDPTSGAVKSVAFNATNVFTAHQDSKIRVWQMAESKKHRLVCTLPTIMDRFRRSLLPKNYVQVQRQRKRLWIEHCDAISGLAVNKGLMYSVSWDKSFKIWNVSNHRCLESVKEAHEDAVNAVVVSDNGAVYTASADGCIKVWERNDGVRRHTLVTTLEKHKSTVNALALNGDGCLLFSGGFDRRILVWERENGETNNMVFREALSGHTGAILCLINVDDLLASGSSDRTVRIWQHGKDTGYHCMVVMEGHEKPVKSLVAVSAGASNGVVSVCSGSLDGEIKIWEIKRITVPQT